MFGAKIKLYRQSKGWSQDQLVDAIKKQGGEISKTAISKFERDLINPTPSTLHFIANALECDPLLFAAPDDFTIVPLAFRKKAKLKSSDRNKILSLCQTQLESYIWLQEKIDPTQIEKLNFERMKIHSPEEAEALATKIREDWKLGPHPIENLTRVFEDNGIYVLPIDENEGFDGYSVLLQNNDKKIVAALASFNKNGSGDRQRFSLAHELAHILFDNDDPKVNEKLAHRFASAFLLPANEVKRVIGSKRTRFTMDELKSYKKHFKASIQAIVYRMKDLEIITEHNFQEIFKIFSRLGWRKNEPEPLSPEKPQKIQMLVHRAVSEGYLSKKEAKERYGITVKIEGNKKLSKVQLLLQKPADEQERILSQQFREANEFYKTDKFLEEIRNSDFDESES